MPFLLNVTSDTITVVARLAAGLAFAIAYRRAGAVRNGWWGRLIMLLLFAGWLLRLCALQAPNLVITTACTIAAGLAFLAAAICVWPFLNRFAAQTSHSATMMMRDRIELAESEVQESRHWLQLAERIAHVGHWRYKVATDELTWSDEIYQIFGVAKSDYVPDIVGMMDFICPNDRPRWQTSFDAAIHRRAAYEISARLQRADSQVRHITARGVPDVDAEGNVVSVFGVFVDITEQRRIQEELKIANQASALANQVLAELAMHDSLTGLPNRRHFDTTLVQEIKRAAREKTPVGLIMVDLDHFKDFNDQYGHPAGDVCLRTVAEAIANVPQRPADLVARYGGEELVVLLPNTDLPGTRTVAAMVVEAVRRLELAHETNTGKIVTVSCGAACFQPEQDPQTPAILIERADQALYLAKRTGRDRVVHLAEAV